MYYDHGKYHTLEKLTNSEHTMFKILTCEEVFHYKRTDITMEMKNIAAMLVETCLYEQDDDGGARYFFENGLCIVQYPFGQAKYV